MCQAKFTFHGLFIILICYFFSFHLFQVQAREREVQQTKDVKEDFSSRLQDIEAKLKTIALKLEDKSADLEEAKEETKVINQTD